MLVMVPLPPVLSLLCPLVFKAWMIDKKRLLESEKALQAWSLLGSSVLPPV